MTVNRSAEELRMRELIVPELRKRWPDGRIVHELPLRYSSNRIDLAAITPTKIVSVEIKSSRDVADRLEAQLRAFLPISAQIIVALAPKWNEKLPSKVEVSDRCTTWTPQYTEVQSVIRRFSSIEVWTVDAEQARIEVTQRSYRERLPSTVALLDVLHVAELQQLAGQHRISHGKRPTHEHLVRDCFELMTGREIVAGACAALRARAAFCAGTDAPICAGAAP